MAQKHYTTCNLCEAGCGIAVTTEGDRIVDIRGDDEDPFSRGYVCPKAVALRDVYEDPDRLRTPVRRTASGWAPIGWSAAFDEVARRVREVQARYGKHSLAIYQGNPTVHSLGAMTFGQLFSQAVHTRNHYSATSTDQLPHMLAGLLMFGHQLLLPVPDIDRTDLMVIIGGNPLASNGSIMTAPDVKRRLDALRARGGKLIVIDPRRTETAAVADRHLFIRPGTDALLLLAMLETLFSEELVQLGRLERHCDGVDEVRAAAGRFPAEEIADAVGIDADTIRSLARSLANAHSAVCYGRMGVCTQEFGGLNAWLLHVINIATGNFDEPGGMMFTTPAFDLVGTFARLGRTGSFARFTGRSRELPEFGGELPCSILADEILTEGPDQIRALFVHAGNPVLSTPNGGKLDSALEQLDFMAAVDLYVNETTRHAHIILPPTTLLEREHFDVAFNMLAVRNVAKYSRAVVPAKPEQRHDWQIFLELWSRLSIGRGRGWLGRGLAAGARQVAGRLGPRAIVDLALRTGPHPLTVRKLLAAPHGVDLGPLQPRLPDALHTPGKRIQLAPEPYLADLDRLVNRTGELAEATGLRLIGRRHLRSNNSWMHNSYRLVKGKPRCTLLIHPDDAAEQRIHDGDRVRVVSAVGEVEAAAEVTDAIMRGTVSLPHGWGHGRDGVRLSVAREHAGVSVNDLTDDALVDELSGNACLNGVPVRVELAT